MLEIHASSVRAADGTELTAFECGGGPGPVFVLCNGLGGNIDAWRYLIDDFGPHHRIVSWDYRGLYKSGPAAPGTGYDVETQVQDLRAVLQHFGIQKAVLLGWSMGVQVSFEAWRQMPEIVQGMVLINGTYGSPLATAFSPMLKDSPLAQMLPAIAKAMESVAHLAEPFQPMAQRVTKTKMALKIVKNLGLASQALDEKMFLTLASEVAGLHMPRYMATLNALAAHSALDVLPSITVPVMVVTGDHDMLTPLAQSREMVKAIAGAELLVIPSGTHYTPLEFPELIHLRVEKWLRERFGFTRPFDR